MLSVTRDVPGAMLGVDVTPNVVRDGDWSRVPFESDEVELESAERDSTGERASGGRMWRATRGRVAM
jgi:hypothetical protein